MLTACIPERGKRMTEYSDSTLSRSSFNVLGFEVVTFLLESISTQNRLMVSKVELYLHIINNSKDDTD